jgi:tripartite motif-containing protein 71
VALIKDEGVDHRNEGERMTGRIRVTDRNSRKAAGFFVRVRQLLAPLLLVALASQLPGLGGSLKTDAIGAPTLTPTLVHTLPTPYVLNGGHAGSYAWGAATMPDRQTVIVSDIFNNRILRYDLNGNAYPSGSSGVVFHTNGLGANPYGIAVDPTDWTIYLGSAQCCGVQVWITSDPLHVSYTFKGVIDPTGGPKSTTSKYPARLAVGADGTVYVADMTLHEISAFSRQATGNAFLYRFGGYGAGNAQFKQPRALALDGGSPQRLYVVDSGNVRIQVFDTSQMSNPTTHGFLYSFGSGGNTVSAFGGNLRGAAYDTVNNHLYVVDMGKNHVEDFQINPLATSGTQDVWVRNIGKADPNLATLTKCCAQPGDFIDGGREAAVDGSGNLWVADMPDFRTQIFAGAVAAKPGSFLFDAPSAAAAQLPAAGQFSFPEGVGVEADGTIIVSDSHNFRLEWFSSPASGYAFQMQEGARGRFNNYGLNYSRNISVNLTTGAFALADTYNNSVHYFAENGTLLWVFGGNGSGSPDAGIQLTAAINSKLGLPSGVGIDNSTTSNQGDIYVADSANKRVVVLDTTGVQLGTIINGPSNGLNVNFADPRGVGVDPSNGDVYVADFPAKKIYHFGVTGSWSAHTAVATLLNIISGNMANPFDVVVDSANQFVYVSDTSAHTILVFSTVSQAFVTSIAIPGQPEGIALAPDGHLWVASRSNDKVFEYCLRSCP